MLISAMEHLIVWTYALLLSSGFAGGLALVFLGLRVRSSLVAPFAALQGLLFLGLTLLAAYFYLDNIAAIAGGPSASLRLGMAFASGPVNIALYLVALGLLHRIRPYSRVRPRLLKLAVFAASTTALAMSVSLLAHTLEALGWIAGKGPVGGKAWSLGVYGVSSLTLALIGWLLLHAKAEREHRSIRLLLKGYGAACLAFAPLGALELVLDSAGFQPYHPLALDYLFYLGCNVAAIAASLASLRVERGDNAAFDALDDDTAAAHNLTERERDMAALIARGLANKEIAAELGISPATVRTHIYNLYQKVGARSRIELLNRLRD